VAQLITSKPTVTVEATIRLNEQEIAALDALAGYGTEAFLKVFYEKLGQSYLKPHEDGLRSVFETVRKYAGPALSRAYRARKILLDSEQ
jgi:hypothetical protein